MHAFPKTMALLLLTHTLFGCGFVRDQSGSPEAATTSAAGLTVEQCSYFAQDGQVTTCHRTSSQKHPYTSITTDVAGCRGHADHLGDYVALADPTCNGQGCLPQGAPFDGSIECCEGLAPVGGYCAPVE